jgi:heme-degrading monooxygenase HmoA
LYRWRIHAGKEDQFVDAWSQVSSLLLRDRGSLGSRLHKCSDGLWYSYAQWPSEQAREAAFALAPIDPAAGARMRDAIAESLPELVLESISDFMIAADQPPR